MKTSDATIRFRSRPDDRRLYEQAAGRADMRLSAWVRGPAATRRRGRPSTSTRAATSCAFACR